MNHSTTRSTNEPTIAKIIEKWKGKSPEMQIHGGTAIQKTDDTELNGYVTLKKRMHIRIMKLRRRGAHTAKTNESTISVSQKTPHATVKICHGLVSMSSTNQSSNEPQETVRFVESKFSNVGNWMNAGIVIEAHSVRQSVSDTQNHGRGSACAQKHWIAPVSQRSSASR